MNKYLLGLVFLLFIFSSCSKDEDLASGLSGYWKQDRKSVCRERVCLYV